MTNSWRSDNREQYLESRKIHSKAARQRMQEDPSKLENFTTKQRARKNNRESRKRVPICLWKDEAQIRELYLKAAELNSGKDEKVHVDHIIPINNNLVCGLHVENNLQIVRSSINEKKSNSFIPYTEKEGVINYISFS